MDGITLLLALSLVAAPQDLYRAAEAAEERGDLEGARHLYATFVERYPASPLLPGALLALAWAEVDLGLPDSALERLRRLERLDAAVGPARLGDAFLYVRARARRGTGDLAGAEADLRDLLGRYPGSNLVLEAEDLLGRVLLERGRPAEAAGYLGAFAAMPGPRGDEARALRAEAFAAAGRYEEALEAWRTVPGETAALRVAEILDRLGRGAEAAAAFRAYVDSWPRGAAAVRAHAAVARFAARRGDTSAAAFHHAALLALPGGERSFWAVEARAFLGRHAPPAEAERHLRALARDHARTPEGAWAIETLAGRALAARRLGEAVDLMTALALVAPDRFAAGAWGRRLAEAYFLMGDAAAGLSALRGYLAGDLSPADRLEAAFLLSVAGRAAEAEPHLLRVVAEGDAEAAGAALVILVRDRLAAGEIDGARAARDLLLANFPEIAARTPLPEIPAPPQEPLPEAAPLEHRLRLHVAPAAYAGDDARGALVGRAVDSLLRLGLPPAADVAAVPPSEIERIDEVVLRGRTDLPPAAVGADIVAFPRLSPAGDGYVLEIDLVWLGRPAPARRVPLRFEIPADGLRDVWGEVGRALLEAIRIEARL